MTHKIREDEGELQAVLRYVQAHRAFDVGVYKPTFLKRRLATRLHARGVDTYRAYLHLLERDSQECSAFLSALSVTLTHFFRDPSAFAAIRQHVLAPLVAARDAAGRHRLHLWCAGCATGEEAYSLAITLLDLLGDARPHWRITLLATDIDEGALDTARAADYAEHSVRYMPPAQRRRYGTATGTRYRLSADVRALVHFRRHDLLRDAFPRHVDLILCRNVMIYFARAEHEGLLRRFHAALAPGGCLLLGRAEVPPRAARGLFAVLESREHLYVRLPDAPRRAT